VHRGPAGSFLEPVKVPFPKVEGIVAVVIENMGNGLHGRVQSRFMGGDAFVGINAGKHRAAERAAQRIAAHRVGEEKTRTGKVIQVGSVHVGVAVNSKGLGPLLICHNPENIFSFFTNDLLLCLTRGNWKIYQHILSFHSLISVKLPVILHL
jgi:hypothetical protein